MLTVSQLAKKANVAPNTVRNHVRDYPNLFSEAARGLHGNRQFDDDDVATLCSLVALKFAGVPLDDAANRLRTEQAPQLIDVAATALQEAAQAPQTGQDAAITLQVVQRNLQRQIDSIERHQLWTHGVAFYLGMVTMGVIFLFVWWLVNG